MKTLLVISRNPEFAEQIKAALAPDVFRVVSHVDIAEAETLLLHGVVDVCVFDMEEFPEKVLGRVETLHKLMPERPIIVYISQPNVELETKAYLKGARYVLRKLVHSALLNVVLNWLSGTVGAPSGVPPALGPPISSRVEAATGGSEGRTGISTGPLTYLKDFASIVGVSLSRTEMLRRFLEVVRLYAGINRAAIFVRHPVPGTHRGTHTLEFRFRPVCGYGLPGLTSQQVELSLGSGICRALYLTGQVLTAESVWVRQDPDVYKEFEVLGIDVAIPIFEFDTLSGVVLLGRKVTGESLSEAEIRDIFFAVEHLGHAIRHTWQYEQLVQNHRVLADLVRDLELACIVVSQDFRIVHINKAARKLLKREVSRVSQIIFDDLPEEIAQKTREVLAASKSVGPFKFELKGATEEVFQINILPMPIHNGETMALIIGEDLSRAEKIRRLEIEAASLRLIHDMAEKSVHEIGNALVPLVTHHELLRSRAQDPRFIASLDAALQESLRKITRRLDQLRYLARDDLRETEPFSIGVLLQEAFEEARLNTSVENAQLVVSELYETELTGDKVALKRTFCEVFMNAIQANPNSPVVYLSVQAKADEQNRPGILVEIVDTGPGFTTEEATRAGTAFWTRRAVGMGLGLAVARKIVALHQGRFEIHPAWEKPGGRVSIWLPLALRRSKRP